VERDPAAADSRGLLESLIRLGQAYLACGEQMANAERLLQETALAHDLEDLKGNLVSVTIAVLAVRFLREAVAWEVRRDLPGFGAALALVVAALTLFLTKHVTPKN
jgi:uncharacterized membrane protein YqhA